MAKRKIYHVVPDPKGWAVKQEGSKRASKRFPTKDEAIKYGKILLKKLD